MHLAWVNGVSQVNEEFRFGAYLHLSVGRGEGSIKEQWCMPALQSPESTALTPSFPALTLS